MKHLLINLFLRTRFAGVVVFVFVLGVLIGLLLSFPAKKIEQKLITIVEQQGRVVVSQGRVQVGLSGIKGADLLIQPETSSAPAIEIDSLSVAPQWLSFLSGNPGGHANVRLYDGDLAADYFRDGTLSAVATGLNLGKIVLDGQPVTISGSLERMVLDSAVPLQKNSTSVVEVVLKKIILTGKSGFPSTLNLGDVLLNGTGRGRSFKITSLRAEGGDLIVSGEGSLLLGRTMPSSRVNMKIKLKPGENLDPMLLDLLKLGSRQLSDGSYELSVSGVLSDLMPLL